MQKVGNSRPPDNSCPPVTQGEAVPPDVLQAKLEAIKADLRDELAEIVRQQNELLLKRHQALKPLLSIRDTATTLGVSERTVEKLVAQGKIRVLWIKGQRKVHPDALEAYMRQCEQKPRGRRRAGV